ncbi:uncharacterized protein [Drosophila takahashii]|uniref:uncharacterized protein n=1 Tax=Drosophila takahashii TaxID=29030 RepID=UPI003898F767
MNCCALQIILFALLAATLASPQGFGGGYGGRVGTLPQIPGQKERLNGPLWSNSGGVLGGQREYGVPGPNIMLFALLSATLARPEGFGYGGRRGIPGLNVGSQNFGRFQGRGGKTSLGLGQKEGINGGLSKFYPHDVQENLK